MEYTFELYDSIEAQQLLVPSLLLQPFVENAIWHGLSTRKGKKRLSLKVELLEPSNDLQITIEDNGIGRRASRLRNSQNPLKSQSLGLSIVNDRLDFYSKKYAGDFHFLVEDLVDASGKALGTKVVVTLPRLLLENH